MEVKSLAEKLLFTTVRIETVYANGNTGSGTGFVYNFEKENKGLYPFIVTNKHVVDGAEQIFLTFIKGENNQPVLGKGYRVEATKQWQWFGHPTPDVDIAVYPLFPLEQFTIRAQGAEIFYRAVTNELIPNEEQEAALDAIESVTFIGYPSGIWDTKNLLPIVRRGQTATPYYVDFENTPRFLIDASVFPGSSGSPVFFLSQGTYMNRQKGAMIGDRIHFAGVVAAVCFRTERNGIIEQPIPTQLGPMVEHREMIDLGIVFKARTVVETIEAYLSALDAADATDATDATKVDP